MRCIIAARSEDRVQGKLKNAVHLIAMATTCFWQVSPPAAEMLRSAAPGQKKYRGAEETVQLRTACRLQRKRDSVWHYEGLVRIAPGEINRTERKMRILSKTYGYQEIGATEVLRLLQNPP
jgi:hypothetical protein